MKSKRQPYLLVYIKSISRIYCFVESMLLEE